MLEAINYLAQKYTLTKEFIAKNARIAKDLLINPEHLLTVYYIESRFNPKAVNKLSNATGIIQWIPSTAKSLGTSVEQIKQMDALDQLDLVYKYMKPYKGKMRNLADVYLAVFFPRAIGKPDNYVLQTSTLDASRIANWNPAYDLNKDDKLTKGEVKQKVTEIAQSIGLSKKKILIGGGIGLMVVAVILLTIFWFVSKKQTKTQI